MKKRFAALVLALVMSAVLHGCGTGRQTSGASLPSEPSDAQTAARTITEETALAGVSNYCHDTYDWSAAEDRPDAMYVTMGEETAAEYQVIFHSYTGSFVYFYVDKATGTTRMTEYVPALDREEDAGAIDLYDYLP